MNVHMSGTFSICCYLKLSIQLDTRGPNKKDVCSSEALEYR